MKIIQYIRLLLVAALLILATNPAGAESVAPPMITPETGNTYYTRFTFHHERDRHNATNYSRGLIWPINTEVKLVSMSERRRGSFVLERTDNGEQITVKNVPKFTQVSLNELASRMLSDQQTPLDHLSPELQTAVKAGQLRLGMDKETAVMARGYPPGHETPTLDLDIWKYWVNRFVHLTVVFEDGVIVEGRGLR